MPLQIGSPAPSSNVETWLRREPTSHLKPTKLYVVEFSASGNQNRAIELVELALKSLDRPKPMLGELKQHLLPNLLQALANYKGEEVCYGNLCAAPQTNFLKARPRGGPRRKDKKHR